MLTLPSEFVHVVIPFAPLFSKRAFRSAQVLVMGAILAIGKRTSPKPCGCAACVGPRTFRPIIA
jgi:hypothetical protein